MTKRTLKSILLAATAAAAVGCGYETQVGDRTVHLYTGIGAHHDVVRIVGGSEELRCLAENSEEGWFHEGEPIKQVKVAGENGTIYFHPEAENPAARQAFDHYSAICRDHIDRALRNYTW